MVNKDPFHPNAILSFSKFFKFSKACFNLTSHGFNFTSCGKIPKIVAKRTRFHQQGSPRVTDNRTALTHENESTHSNLQINYLFKFPGQL